MTESVATHSSINHLHAPVTALMFDCSGTQIYVPDVRDEASDELWDNDRASWSIEYYLGLKPTLNEQKAKVLPLDHRCLLTNVISYTILPQTMLFIRFCFVASRFSFLKILSFQFQ